MKTFSFTTLLILCLSCSCLQKNHSPNFQSPLLQQIENPTSLGLLKIVVLNVGQGDATLITSPEEKSLLIDAGGPGKGREVILPYLQEQQIRELDYMLASHFDQDHIGGFADLVAGEDGLLHTEDDITPQQNLLDRGGYPLDYAPAFSSYLEALSTFRSPLYLDEEINLGPSLAIKIVSMNGEVINETPINLSDPHFFGAENAASIGVFIQYKNFSYLTCGDLSGGGNPGGYDSWDLETLLSEQLNPVSALHANHHGSATSSNAAFVEALQPKAVFFSVGNFNDYHHPNQEVLERWRDVGADLWLTEKGSGGFIAGEHIVNGPIVLETDGEKMWVNGTEYNLK